MRVSNVGNATKESDQADFSHGLLEAVDALDAPGLDGATVWRE
jgi:hypothetical protein